MKPSPKRTKSLVPKAKKAKRVQTEQQQADANLGATEADVVPLTPPAADTPVPHATETTAPQLNPNDELTPG